MVEIPTKDKKIVEDGIDVSLRFETSRGRIKYDHNSPELVERGIKRWIRKELGL